MQNDDFGFAIKNECGEYYTGLGWDKQLRKAKLYHSYKYAVDVRDNPAYAAMGTKIVKVRISEECDYNPDWEV